MWLFNVVQGSGGPAQNCVSCASGQPIPSAPAVRPILIMITIPRELLLRVMVSTSDSWNGDDLWQSARPEDRDAAFEKPPAKRTLFLLGRRLARRLLPVPEWRIDTDAAGRPCVAEPGWDVSFSHSGRWVAVAVGRGGAVGVDVEAKRSMPNARAIATAYFSREECRQVARDGSDALLAFWTMREAVGKGCGLGLSAALSLDGRQLADGRGATQAVAATGRNWIVGHRDLGPCHVAVAWTPPVAGTYYLRNAALLRRVSISLSRLRIQKL